MKFDQLWAMAAKLPVVFALVMGSAACDRPGDLVDGTEATSAAASEAQKVADQVASAAADQAATTEETVTSKVDGSLKKDMAYADLRKIVLGNGWNPVIDRSCKKNVGGDGAICDHLPELESCSGDGYCIVHFENAVTGERLDVTSYGMVEDWNVAGDESRLNVVEWNFSKAPLK